MSFQERITNYVKASFPCVAVITTEETRAQGDIIAAAKAAGRDVFTWSATEGLRGVIPIARVIPDTEDLGPACQAVIDQCENAVIIFRDLHTWSDIFARDPKLDRIFRDMIAEAPVDSCTVIVISPQFAPRASIEKLVTVMEYTLPDQPALFAIAEGIARGFSKPDMMITPEILRAMGGLSTTEAENALALSCIETNGFDPAVVYREKVTAVRRSGLLDVVEPDARGLDGIGGLVNLKAWITRRRRAYSPEAEAFGLPAPKGVLIVGVPGTGKSLSAKAFGTALNVPTIKLDIGSMFNSLVGESESRIRDTLKLAEAMAPCVLWIDEIDKGLAGSSGGSGDSGVAKRVFGTIITWMQDRKRPVFVVATANDVTSLPPELLRKGRFDEIFAVDLPAPSERNAIFCIQLAKVKRSIEIDGSIIDATEGFTGSEIESVIHEGLHAAFEAGRDLTSADLLDAARVTVPLITTAREQIEVIRTWAKNRARPASIADAVNKSDGYRKF